MPNYQIITFKRKGYLGKDNSNNKHTFENIPLSKDVIVLGYSWGNVPAFKFAASNYAHIKGIVLVSPYLYPTKKIDGIKKFLIVDTFLGDAFFKLFGKRIISNFLKKSFYPLFVPIDYQKLINKLSNPDLLRTAIEEKEKNYISEDVLKIINAAKIPVAIIWGDKDLTSKENKQIFPIRRIIHPVVERCVHNAGHAILFTHTKDLAEFITSFITTIGRKKST